MMLKNRKIYGIDATSFDDKTNLFYLNFGEGRYSYVSFENFLKFVKTWKIQKNSSWVDLVDYLFSNTSYGFCQEAIKIIRLIANTIPSMMGKVAIFEDVSVLLERGIFVPLKDGKMKYKKILNTSSFTIKYNINGTDGFSIWKNNKCYENNIWSLSECYTTIEGMK